MLVLCLQSAADSSLNKSLAFIKRTQPKQKGLPFYEAGAVRFFGPSSHERVALVRHTYDIVVVLKRLMNFSYAFCKPCVNKPRLQNLAVSYQPPAQLRLQIEGLQIVDLQLRCCYATPLGYKSKAFVSVALQIYDLQLRCCYAYFSFAKVSPWVCLANSRCCVATSWVCLANSRCCVATSWICLANSRCCVATSWICLANSRCCVATSWICSKSVAKVRKRSGYGFVSSRLHLENLYAGGKIC